MSSRPANYAKLTGDQVGVLEKHFEEGMNSTTCLQQIQKAVEETSLPLEKVKKWIGNKISRIKKRQMQQLNSEPPACTPPKVPNPPPGIRGSSGYNLFCSHFFQSDEVKGISNLAKKNKMASTKWNDLPIHVKQGWTEKAIAKKNASCSLDKETQQKLIDQHIKLVAKELNYLESLGCDSQCLIVNEKKQIFVLGSSQGKNFLHSEPAMICKFQSNFGEARGVVGARVPYLSGGFRVEGLPENIRLKKPRQYGSNEIKRMMSRKDDIRFITESNAERETSSVGNKDSDKLLRKVFGKTNFFGNKISKDDVQALGIEKFASVSVVEELITTCKNLFMADAFADLKAKLSNAKGLILPIYCNEEEEDNFWLFYFPNSVTDLQEKSPKDKLVGYWLDHDSTSNFRLLNKKVPIIGENIIKDGQKFIFAVHKFNDEIQSFELDDSFQKKIVDVLSRQGYI